MEWIDKTLYYKKIKFIAPNQATQIYLWVCLKKDT